MTISGLCNALVTLSFKSSELGGLVVLLSVSGVSRTSVTTSPVLFVLVVSVGVVVALDTGSICLDNEPFWGGS